MDAGNFTSKCICDTYKSILNIAVNTDNDGLEAGSMCNIRDSIGCSSAVSLGIAGEGVCISGTSCIVGNLSTSADLSAGGSAVIGGTLNSGYGTIDGIDITGNATITGSLTADNGSFTVTPNCTTTTNETCIANTLAVADDLIVGGGIVAGEDIIAYYSSDCRLKSDLNTITNTQSIIDSLTGYSFEWNEKSGKVGPDLGLMAQDVQEVLPSIVKQRDNGYLAVDYIKLIPVLIEEVKRLNAEVEELKGA